MEKGRALSLGRNGEQDKDVGDSAYRCTVFHLLLPAEYASPIMYNEQGRCWRAHMGTGGQGIITELELELSAGREKGLGCTLYTVQVRT